MYIQTQASLGTPLSVKAQQPGGSAYIGLSLIIQCFERTCTHCCLGLLGTQVTRICPWKVFACRKGVPEIMSCGDGLSFLWDGGHDSSCLGGKTQSLCLAYSRWPNSTDLLLQICLPRAGRPGSRWGVLTVQAADSKRQGAHL